MDEQLTHIGKHPYVRPLPGDVVIDDYGRVFHIVGVDRTRTGNKLETVFRYDNPGEFPQQILASDMVPDYRIYRYMARR